MNLKNTIPFVISILSFAGLASAGALATPQGDAPKPAPSGSAKPKEKPKAPKAEQPKKPPADEGGW